MADSSPPSRFETSPPPPNKEMLRAKWAEEQRLLLMSALDAIADAVFATQINGRITYMNPAAEAMFGLSKERVRDNKIFLYDYVSNPDGQPAGQLLIDAVRFDPVNGISRQHMQIHSEDQVTEVLVSASGVILHCELARVLCTCTDITREVRHQRELERLALTDELTQIYNRRWFHQYLERKVRRASSGKTMVGVTFIDLDKFKVYNDAAGFEAGDVLIRLIVAIIQESLPPHFYVARVGGDEFVLVSDQTSHDEMMTVAARINEDLQKVYLSFYAGQGLENVQGTRICVTSDMRDADINWLTGLAIRKLDMKVKMVPESSGYRVGASIGVSVLASRNPSFSQIFTLAENAKREAKSRGRGCVVTLP